MGGLKGPLDDDDDIISDINVTPLVDVALVLLIIFIATSAIIVRAAINVDLPKAASAGEALPDSVGIMLGIDGSIRLDGQPVTEAELQAALEARADANPEVRALIAADRDLDYGAVMDIIDVVRLSGIAGFSLNVERETRDQP